MKSAKFFQTILLSTGAGAIFTFIVSLFSSTIAQTEFFQAMILGMIFVGIAGWLFFEKKIISPNIWVRRFFSIVIDYFIILASMLMFGVFSPTPLRLFIQISVGLGGSFLFGVPLWILADRAEKRYLRQINEKLEKNE